MAGLALLLSAGLATLWFFSSTRERDAALRQAAELRDTGRLDLAVLHLNRYLQLRPSDTEILAAQARNYDILFKKRDRLTSREEIQAAISINDRLLRSIPQNHPEADPARRRLASLYIKFSDELASIPYTQFVPDRVAQESRYGAAQVIAQGLVDKNGEDVEARRLLAQALDGLAVPSNPQVLNKAIENYQIVLRLDPKDKDSAGRLARLYRDRYQWIALKDGEQAGQTNASLRQVGRAKAIAVLDNLLAALPNDPEVRLIRYRFFVEDQTDPNLARQELQAALQMAPNSSWVRLAAAEQAIRDGKSEEARDHITAINPDKDEDPENTRFRTQILKGLAEFADKSPYAALVQWRQGLIQRDGAHAELNWWMAYVQLRLGQPGAADPYISQYRRLIGSKPSDLEANELKFLDALRHEQLGQWADALRTLDSLRYNSADPRLGLEVPMAVGRCREAIGDVSGALVAYREAQSNFPSSIIPKLAIASVEARRDPDRAIANLRLAYDGDPNSPELLAALIQAYILRLSALPPNQRIFAEVDELIQNLEQLDPNSPSLVLLRADRLILDPKSGGDGVPSLLEEAVKKRPRDRVLWMAWAEALLNQGKPQLALDVLDHATRPDAAGDHVDLRLVRAQALLKLGRGREVQSVLQPNPDTLSPDQRATLYEALGQLRANQGDLLGARNAYSEWVKLAPGSPRPLLALIRIAVRLGDRAEADRLLEQFDTLSSQSATPRAPGSPPSSPAGKLAAATIETYFADSSPDTRSISARRAIANRLGKALKLLEDVPQPSPNSLKREVADPSAYALRGLIYERLAQLELDDATRNQNLERAIANYKEAWAGGAGEVLPRLVDLLARAGRTDDLDRLQSQAPTPIVSRLSAQALILNGQSARGDALINELAPTSSNNRADNNWRIRLLSMAGRFDELEAELLARARAASSGNFTPWLLLLGFQADRGRPPSVLDATIKEFHSRIPSGTPRPDLLEAQILRSARRWSAADHAYETAASTGANDPITLTAVAEYFASTGRTQRAIDFYRKALQAQPNARAVARELAVLLSGLGDPASWNEAWTLVQPEASPEERPEDRLARAVVLGRSADPAQRTQVVPLLTDVIADLDPTYPTAASARDYMVRTLLATGRPELAASYAAVSATLSGTPPELALHAECLLASHQFKAAEIELDRLFLLDPLSSDEARLRARLVLERGGPEAPAALVEAVAQRKAAAAATLGRAAFSLLIERAAADPAALDAAEQLARRLTADNPALGWMLARVLLKRGQPADAMPPCLASAEAPEASEADRSEAARAALTAFARDRNLSTQAAQILDATLRYLPTSTELLALRALLFHEQGQFQDEVRLYRQALDLIPADHPSADLIVNNLAWALSESLRLPAEALPLIDGLLRRRGPEPRWLCTRGVILARLGDHNRAIADLRQAVEKEPDGRRLFYLARAYHSAGQKDLARQCLEQARQAGLSDASLDPSERDDLRTMTAS